MKRLVLILGGARSGKSTLAEKLASAAGDSVLFVATAEAGDEEMQRRIEAHKRGRQMDWTTLEAPQHVGKALSGSADKPGVVLLDCLTLLTSNVILGAWTPEMEENWDHSAAAAAVDAELTELLEWYEGFDGALIIVSNEVGEGVVPAYPLGRVYRDLLGYANKRLAEVADEVYFMIAGIPLDLKKLGARLEDVSW
ncbi:MAG: bifunctional adenosylcobinamide kinase/adenosylcobinamide-phosphate guanylyltransferase [Chloroflexi bacterium]|nr:bifunctional adenosylcobinamide kinase/adenosylcobinamide-phosphate guanylyltransferase [Chloroflexota bacterium]